MAFAFGATSCGMIANLRAKHQQKKRDKAVRELVQANADQTAARLGAEAVGEISYVDDESGFVLIRQLVGKRIAPNTPLLAKGADGRLTQLRSSPAAKASFIAADIVKGRPEKGDSVLPDVIKKEDAMATASAEAAPTMKTEVTDAPPAETPTKRHLDPLLPPLDPLQPPSDDTSSPAPPLEPELPR